MKRQQLTARYCGLALTLGLGILGASCSSTLPITEGRPLPFHLAIIPTEILDTTVLTSATIEASHKPTEEEDDNLRLDLVSSDVSQVLASELSHAFVRTSVLEEPADAAAWSAAKLERYWQERALEVDADILIRTRLLIDPNIKSSRNEKFWLNLPVHLFLGPVCYFVNDRTYELSARLQAEIFDTTQRHESLQDYSLLRIPLYTEFQETDLRFLDRAEGFGDYALSILVPVGLLARDSSRVKDALRERVPQALGRQLATKVFAERVQFEQNPDLGVFRLASEDLTVENLADDRIHIRVPVQDLTEREALHRYDVYAGDQVLASNDFHGSAALGDMRFIDEQVALPAEARFLTIRVTDVHANARSYTLEVRPARP